MNRVLLSFGFFLLFALALFAVNHFWRGGEHGRAEASTNIAVDLRENGVFSEAIRQSEMRRDILQDNDAFIGLRGGDIAALLSEPEIVRQDLPTVVWQYRNDFCVLDVYFTAAKADVSASPVVHYDLRSRAVSRKAADTNFSPEACISDIAQDNNLVSFLDISPFYKSSGSKER